MRNGVQHDVEVGEGGARLIGPEFVWRENPDLAEGLNAAVQVGLLAVRATGQANMMSAREVQWVANTLSHYALVVFCEDCMRARPREDGARAYTTALARMGETVAAGRGEVNG